MLERGGVEYVNTSEGADLFGVTFITFKGIVEEFDLKGQKFRGQGQSVFYPKKFVELIRDTPPSGLEDLKKQIEEFQQLKK